MHYDLRQLTTSQIVRLSNRTWDRMTGHYGYQAFGFDRPTMALLEPGYLAILDSCRNEIIRRLHA